MALVVLLVRPVRPVRPEAGGEVLSHERRPRHRRRAPAVRLAGTSLPAALLCRSPTASSRRSAPSYLFEAILLPFLALGLAGVGLNLLTGYCGQLSLGSAAFMAVGAFAAYNFDLRVPGLPLLGVDRCWRR